MIVVYKKEIICYIILSLEWNLKPVAMIIQYASKSEMLVLPIFWKILNVSHGTTLLWCFIILIVHDTQFLLEYKKCKTEKFNLLRQSTNIIAKNPKRLAVNNQ